MKHFRRKWRKRADQTQKEAKNSRRRNSRRETEKTSAELMGRDKNILLSKQSGCLSISRSASTHARMYVHQRCNAWVAAADRATAGAAVRKQTDGKR